MLPEQIDNMSNADQTTYFGSVKVYPVYQQENPMTSTVHSWTGDTQVSALSEKQEHDESELPRRILSSEDTASVKSAMTEHYLDQIKDREERASTRANIDFLREQGFHVRGHFVDGKYFVKFATPTKVEVMSIKSFIKAKIRDLVQH